MKKPERTWHIKRGDLKAATAARHAFSRYVRTKNAGDTASYDAALIFGELVSNAVRCARSSVSVEVIEDGWAELHVIDDGDCFDRAGRIVPAPVSAYGGRGLYIVNLLARTLDVSVGERRCEVTAVLPIRA
jgi:anti-sigma regulatory factor (Ser/Thr protein kinase)